MARYTRIVVAAALFYLSAMAGPVAAEDILPGTDQFELIEAAFTLEVPANTVMPGSEPWAGTMTMAIVSEDPAIAGPQLRRPTTAEFSAGAATVEVEMAQLKLESTAPVTILTPIGPAFYYVQVTATATTDGELRLTQTNADGGEITDGFVEIAYDIDFYETCGCSHFAMPSRTESLFLVDATPWSFAAPDEAMIGPDTSNFFPGGTPGDPAVAPAAMQFAGTNLCLDLRLQRPAPLPSILGDANLDGVVDLEDFVLLKQYFGRAAGATWGMGDFNLDGKTDLNDFVILKAHFGERG